VRTVIPGDDSGRLSGFFDYSDWQRARTLNVALQGGRDVNRLRSFRRLGSPVDGDRM